LGRGEEGELSDETLIEDMRGRISPSEWVERRLQAILGYVPFSPIMRRANLRGEVKGEKSMGYCISVHNVKFHIKEANKRPALKAVRALHGKETIKDSSGKHFSGYAPTTS